MQTYVLLWPRLAVPVVCRRCRMTYMNELAGSLPQACCHPWLDGCATHCCAAAAAAAAAGVGIQFSDLSPDGGRLVEGPLAESPAEAAGIRKGDRVLDIGECRADRQAGGRAGAAPASSTAVHTVGASWCNLRQICSEVPACPAHTLGQVCAAAAMCGTSPSMLQTSQGCEEHAAVSTVPYQQPRPDCLPP